jgi:hypothetical protein
MKNLLNYLKPQDICTIFEKVHSHKEDSENIAWKKRASNLLNLSMNIADYIQEPTKRKQTLEALVIDNLLEFYYNRKLEPSLHTKLSNYIENTPGFDKSKEKQNDNFYQQHGFLSMQLIRYIGDISIDSDEYLIFHSNWISTQEKKLVVTNCFKSIFSDDDLDILKIFDNMKPELSLTNFTYWDFYLKNSNNSILLDFTCNVLEYKASLPMTKYYEFLRKVRIIDLKDSLSIELNNKDVINKKNVIKI